MNNEYEVIYNKYKELEWTQNTMFGAISIQWRLNSVFQKKYEELVIKEYKAKYPRRKKIDFNKIVSKEEDIVEKVVGILQPVALKYYEHKLKKYLEYDKYLHATTIKLEITNDWHLIRESNSGTYSSQGYGAYKYARNALLYYEKVLDLYGVEYKVETVVTKYEHNNPYSLKRSNNYQLYAKVKPYMFHYLMLNSGITDEEMSQVYYENGVNEKVYGF